MTTLQKYLTQRNIRIALAVLSAILTSLGVAAGVVLTGPDGKTTTFTVGGPHGTPTTTVQAPASAVSAAQDGLDSHQGARSEQPSGVSGAQLDAARDQQEALAETDQLPIVTPDAAPVQRGCVTRLVQDFSSRRGVRPRLFVLHYTVSGNRPGWDDVNAVVSLFNTWSFQASSNYVIDGEGHCAYIVRESDKAWTQAAANPVSISVEVINTGHELQYAAPAGLAKIALVAHDAMKRWGIPLQMGAVSGCVVTRPGILDHGSLGACGGGHHDISPYPVAPVLAAIKALDTPALPPVAAENAVCTVKNLNVRLGLKASWKATAATRSAIKRVQARYGLRQTGHAGVNVGRALKLRWCHVV
jgi:hypothetical protein